MCGWCSRVKIKAQASREIVLPHIDFSNQRIFRFRIANSFPNWCCSGRLEASLVAQRLNQLGIYSDFRAEFESKELKYGWLLNLSPSLSNSNSLAATMHTAKIFKCSMVGNPT